MQNVKSFTFVNFNLIKKNAAKHISYYVKVNKSDAKQNTDT